MKQALIIGNSGGIGRAVQGELQARGYEVTGLSRREHGLDVTQESSIIRHLDGLTGPFDLVFVASGALEIAGAAPEKTLQSLTPSALIDQFALNAMGPALVLKHVVPLLPKSRPAVFAALSARVGSIGDNRLGGWYSYRTSKTALNQLMHGAAVELARTHKQLCLVCLHPGTVATSFTEKYLGRHPAVGPGEAARNLVDVMEQLSPDQTGRFFDYAGQEIPW